MANQNIQETGALNYKDLQGLNNNPEEIEDFRQRFGIKRIDGPSNIEKTNPALNAERDMYSPLYDDKGDYWGRSRFDRRNPVVNDDQFGNLSDMRANEQSGFNKVLNGTIKMLSTAGTTFLDNTIGFVWGLGQGVANLADEDEDTNFWKGLWDNDFNKAMMSAQDAMEKIAPNYYTQKELENPWYKNIFTANFWGDKFLKNMGFTMGSVASMAVGFGDIGALAGAGTTALTKSIALGKTLKGTKLANSMIRGSERAGQIAQKLVNTAISAHGEAAIEAINAVKANEEAFLQNLDNWKKGKIQEAQQWYEANMFLPGAYEEYMDRLHEIDLGTEQAMIENDATMRSLGNSVYGMNMLLLGITNNLEFGKYIKGGFNQNKGIAGGARVLVDGTQTTDLRAAGRAMAEGKKVSFGADDSLKKIDASKIGGIIGGTFARNIEEGFEEGAQNLISDSGQMQAQAKVNVNLKNWSKKHENSLFAQSLNPEVTDDLVNRSKAFINAWNENFGNGFDAPGWEEVFLGALTGGIGTLGFRIDNKTGRVVPSWQGGFWEEISKYREEYGRQEEAAERLNKAFNTDSFRKNVSNALAALSLTDGMEDDLINNDILKYKNKELALVANQAFQAKDLGALEMFRGFYEGLAHNISEQDINDIKASFRDNTNGTSYFDNLSNDEIRKRMKDKAQSTLQKVDTILESYDWHLRNYGDTFAANSPFPGMAETAIRELAVTDSLIKDLQRRKQELSSDTQSDHTADIEAIDEEIKKTREKYNNYTKDPKNLFDYMLNTIKESAQAQVIKDSEEIRNALTEAKTLQDVANIYYRSNPEERQSIFDEVYNNATPETKQTLNAFKDYLATAQALPAVISERIADYGNSLSSEGAQAYQRRLGNILDKVVTRLAVGNGVNQQNPKGIIVNAIKEEANNMRQGTGDYIRTDSNKEFLDALAGELDNIADKLNLYNVVYHTSQSAKQSTPQQPKQQEQRPTPQPVEEKQSKQDNLQEAEKKEPTTIPETYTTPEFNGGYVILAKNTQDSTDGQLQLVDDPVKAKQRKGQVKLWFKSSTGFEDFLSRIQAVGFKVHPADVKGLKSAYEAAKAGVINDEQFSDLFVRDEYKSTAVQKLEPQAPTESPREEKKESERSESYGTPEVSLRGQSFLRYSVNGHIASLNNTPSAAWFRDMWNNLNMGYSLDDIQNNYIWQLLKLDSFKDKDDKGRIPVRYVKFNNHLTKSNGEDAGLNRFVFLATEYTDAVKNVFPAEMRSKFRLLEKNGKQYLIIGSLGAYSPERAKGEEVVLTPLEKMFNDINSEVTKLVEESPDAAYQILDAGENGEYTNYIYQVNNGEIITGFKGQDQSPRSLKDLLNNPESNPRNLEAKDLVFAIVMGNEQTGELYTKLIGNDIDESTLRPFTLQYAGQVYLYIPDSTGMMIPWGVDPITYTEIMSLDEDNPIRKEIQDLIHSLAEALAGADSSDEKIKERRMIIAQLRDTLLFGSPDIKGSNFIYDEYREEDTDGDYTVTVGHTLEYFVAGNSFGKVPLGDKTPEQVEELLGEMLRSIDPNYNIKSNVLSSNPSYYIDNGVINTTAKVLAAVNARSFVYPVNDDMTPDVEFKVTRENPETQVSGSGKHVWFGRQMYRMTDKGFETKEGIAVKDPSLTQTLTDIIGLTPKNATFTYRKAPYWIVGDNTYTSTKDGGFFKVDKEDADKKYTFYKNRQEAEKRKEAAQKILKEKEQTPPQLPDEKQEVTEKKPVEKKPSEKPSNIEESSIFVDRFATYQSKLITGEQAGYMNTLEGSNDYFDTLGKDTIDATTLDVLTIMVGKKLGTDPTEITLDKVRQEIWSSKYQSRLVNATELSDSQKANEAIDEVIDNIIKCGL